MPRDENSAFAEFRRMIGWIALAGVLMVIGALWYISLYEPLRLHMVIATVAGVFFSVLLGCGLFAAAFYSDKSGHDQNVTDATRRDRDES
jgi:glucan phosphoethanolaminetransferase (alkaline phosphatase superfamily)